MKTVIDEEQEIIHFEEIEKDLTLRNNRALKNFTIEILNLVLAKVTENEKLIQIQKSTYFFFYFLLKYTDFNVPER